MSDPNFPPPPEGTPPPPPPGGTPPPPPAPPGGPGYGAPTPPPPPAPPGGPGYGAPPPPPAAAPPPSAPPPGGFGGPPPPGGGGFGAPPPPPGGFGGPPPPGAGGPPPPGAGGFGGGYGQPPAQPYGGPGGEMPQLDVGAALSYGWKKFTANAGPLLVIMLAIAIISSIAAVVVGLLQAGGSLSISDSGLSMRLKPTFIGMIWNTVLQVVMAAVIFSLLSVLYRAVLGITKGQAPTAESVMKTDNLAPYLVTSAIIAVIPAAIQSVLAWVSPLLGLVVGLLLIIWYVVTAFAPLIALDRGGQPLDAINQSIAWFKDNPGGFGLIVVVSSIVAAIGVILCCVGLLASFPVGMIALAYAYRALNNETVAA